jgi:hypothetical protein
MVANTTQILFLYQLRKINRKHAIKVDELHAGCRCFTTCCCEDRGNDDKAAGVMVPCRIRSNPPPRTRCSGLWTGVDVLDRCEVRRTLVPVATWAPVLPACAKRIAICRVPHG